MTLVTSRPTEYPKDKLAKYDAFFATMEKENLLHTSNLRMYRIHDIVVTEDIEYTVINFIDDKYDSPVWALLTFNEEGQIEYEIFKTMGYVHKYLAQYFDRVHFFVYSKPHTRWFYTESYAMPLART